MCGDLGCEELMMAQGFCRRHYYQRRRDGRLNRVRPDWSSWARFLSKTAIDPDGCWLWTGTILPNGYGRFSLGGEMVVAHRASWEFHCPGQPPQPGQQLDHLCRVKECVNPEHLELVTGSENQRRSRVARLGPWETCPTCGGKDYGPHGRDRRCRTCHARRAHARRAQKRQAAL